MTPVEYGSDRQPRERRILVNEVIGEADFNAFFFSTAFICVLTAVFDGFDSAVFGVATPLLIKGLGIPASQVGILASVGMVGMFVGSFVFGVLGDLIGSKRSLIICTVVFCLFTGLCGATDDFFQFAVLRFIAGVGLAGLAPNAGALMSEYCPKRLRSSTIPFLSFGIMLGSIVVSLVGIVFVNSFGWRALFFTSLILLPIVVLQILLLPESMNQYLRHSNRKAVVATLRKANPGFAPSDADAYELPKIDVSKKSVGELFTPTFLANTLLFFGILFCNYFIIFGTTMWLPKLMMQVGNSYTLSLWFNIIFFVGALIGIPAGAYMASKVEIKKVLFLFYVLSGGAIAFLWIKANVYVIFILLLVGGGSLQAVQGLMTAYVAQNYPLAVRSSALGTIWMVGRIGSIVSPTVLGILLSAEVKVEVDFIVLALPCLLSIIMVMLTRDYTKLDESRPQPEPARVPQHAA